MNENYQKAEQIMKALQLTEQQINPNNPAMPISKPVIVGDERTRLITELVNVLAPQPEA